MNYQEALAAARGNIGPYCKACPECNGKACGNKIPGPGTKGFGDTAIRNYDAWKSIRVVMDTIVENTEPDTSVELFGRTFNFPFFAGPVGAVNLHYGDSLDDMAYNNILVRACAEAGIAAFTGDGTNPKVVEAAAEAINAAKGCGIPTIKPWDLGTIQTKFALVEAAEPCAIAMDIDAAGLPFLKNLNPPAGSKTVEEMREIVSLTNRPFIIKGIMSVKGALKAREAGAYGIVVSNHGGRVLDGCDATAHVLEEIATAIGNDMKIFVDGGIRSGTDVFRALALGADAVLIARPFVVSVYGGKEDGVKAYIQKLGAELAETMKMCGAASLADITRDMICVR
jgi:isopentenyl diphosphate isomerase/L-lactate dehydrogenase-like FMN-dependent dehydrogenase